MPDSLPYKTIDVKPIYCGGAHSLNHRGFFVGERKTTEANYLQENMFVWAFPFELNHYAQRVIESLKEKFPEDQREGIPLVRDIITLKKYRDLILYGFVSCPTEATAIIRTKAFEWAENRAKVLEGTLNFLLPIDLSNIRVAGYPD